MMDQRKDVNADDIQDVHPVMNKLPESRSLTLVSTQFVSRRVLSSSPSVRSGLPGLLIPAEKLNITVSLFSSDLCCF